MTPSPVPFPAATLTPQGDRAIDLDGTQWILVSLGGGEVLELGSITLKFYDGDYMEGEAGCNAYGAKYRLRADRFSIQERGVDRTRSECSSREVAREREAYYAALKRATDLRVSGDRLELRDVRGIVLLRFERKRRPPLDPALAESTWMLVRLNGRALVKGTHVTAGFGPQRVGGYAGCNAYGAEYDAASGGILRIGGISSTARGCGSETVSRQEEAYIEALSDAATYRIERSSLEVRDAAGRLILQYERQQPVSPAKPAALVGTQWRLAELAGPGAAPRRRLGLFGGETVTLAFVRGGTIRGVAGCEGYSGMYRATTEGIGFPSLASGPATCAGSRAQVLERYTSSLEWTTTYRRTADRLELYTAQGMTLTFHPLTRER